MATKPSDKAKRPATPTGKGAPAKRAPNTARKKPAVKDEKPTPATKARGPESKPLTARQADFVREYLIDLHGTQAYMRAFPGVTEKSARTNASRMLASANIQDAIAIERNKTAQRLELTRDQVIEQYRRLGFSDIRKAFNAYGQLKPLADLDDDTAAAIQGYEVEMRMLDGPDDPPVPVLKVKWADRKTALDSIMKAQGWNSAEKHEVTGKNGGAIQHSVRVVLVPPKEKAQVLTRPMKREGE